MDTQKKIGQLNNTAVKSTEQVLMAALNTVIEMLNDRGYTNIQACQSIEEIQTNMADNRYVAAGGGEFVVHVFFHNEDRVGVKQLRMWVESSNADRIIVVSLEGPTSFTKRDADTNYPQVQFFSFRAVCVTITKHKMVPRHEKLSDKSQVPVELSPSCGELPVLFTTDRVAQYYAYEAGDIIRVTRTVGSQEPMFYYRIVRPPPAS